MNRASLLHDEHAEVRPWYREVWPWVIFGLPLTTMAAGVFMVVLAVTHADPVVVEDWYREGRAYNRHLELERQAERFGLGARITRGAEGIHLRLASRVRLPAPATLTLHLRHPTLAERDLRVELARQPDDSYFAPGATLPTGERHVTLDGPGWRLVRRLVVHADQPIALGASEP